MYRIICENPAEGRRLALAEDGDLCVLKDGQWRRLGFNERFAGEFPPCTFQDILYARDDFYAAGTTDGGQAVLYSSLTGELWTPVNLTEQHYWEENGQLPKGGELIDIRPQQRRLLEGPIPCTAAVDPEDLDDYLQSKDPDARLFFICSFGTVADQATWHAYRRGFRNARSIGGYHKGHHID